ncbi:MAG: hypothetical protein KDK91_26745 [Gammaproteobacteria bacterium]|nr:hypothetical protein [Gammaproteobacteria bacterium]
MLNRLEPLLRRYVAGAEVRQNAENGDVHPLPGPGLGTAPRDELLARDDLIRRVSSL